MSQRFRVLEELYESVDSLYKFLEAQGYKGSLGDMMMLWLDDQSVAEGSLPDRILASSSNEGNALVWNDTLLWDDTETWEEFTEE